MGARLNEPVPGFWEMRNMKESEAEPLLPPPACYCESRLMGGARASRTVSYAVDLCYIHFILKNLVIVVVHFFRGKPQAVKVGSFPI